MVPLLEVGVRFIVRFKSLYPITPIDPVDVCPYTILSYAK